jgi:hypothetical protein
VKGANKLIYFTAVRSFLLLILVFTCSSECFAQTEQWDTYITKIDSKPASIMVDMGLAANAPDRRYPSLVITGPVAHKCSKRGFPAQEEMNALEDILSSTGSFLSGRTAKVLAGTSTCDCKRVNYYYVKDTFGVRSAIARMYNRSYKDYDYVVKIKPDPEWQTYSKLLYPDSATVNWMENDKIITRMIEEGDSLKKPRTINFEFYFYSEADRKNFTDYEAGKGYSPGMMSQTRAKTAVYSLVLSKYGPVNMEDINATTTTLKVDAKKYRGSFAGWAAPLKK